MALPAQTSLLRRIIVGVALLGVVVVTHLALQKANGFAAGCTGFGDVDFGAGAATTGETAGCATVTQGEYADFLGIPNIWLGLVFYVVLVGLRLAYVAVRDDRLRLASGAAVSLGLLYTGYLVYLQAAVIGAFCPLCMTSAALVLTLFVLHVIEHRRLHDAPAPTPRRRAAPEPSGVGALRPYYALLGVFVILLAGTFGLAAQTAPDDADAFATPASDGPPAVPTPRIQDVTGACTYDAAYEPITDLSPFMTGPMRGNPDAAVTVVEVFDPNCPHCRELGEVLEPFAAENPEAAAYYYVPYPLRQQSLGQIIALKMAEERGDAVFFELMEEMFARQDATWGMTVPELRATVEAVGMDGQAFEDTLNDEDALRGYLQQIEATANAVGESFAREDGSLSVPKLAINGRIVESTYASYSARCLGEFVSQAAAPTE